MGKYGRVAAAPLLAPRPAAQLFGDAGSLRGYALSFKVAFTDLTQRSARPAATTMIQHALCGWGMKQKHGFTLDMRETPECLEGIIEGIHNGNVTNNTLAALKKCIYQLLRSGKRSKARDRVWKCDYCTTVFGDHAKPEEMVTSWILRNGSRPGYVRFQTTRPEIQVLPQPVAAAAVPTHEKSGHIGPSELSQSLPDVLAALEVERHSLRNKVEQIASFKDAMDCFGDVVQIVEVMYTFLKQGAQLEGKGGVQGNSRQAAVSGSVDQGGAANSSGSSSATATVTPPRPSSAAASAGSTAGRRRSSTHSCL